MSQSRGYRSYRGRGSRLKIALAVFLALVILVSLTFVALSRYIAYDEDGTPFLRLPPREEAEPPPQETGEEPPVDIQIQPPEDPEPERTAPVWAYSLPEEALTQEGWAAALEAMEGADFDAVVYLAKDLNSNVYFDTESDASGLVRRAKKDTAEAIAAMNQSDYHTIARLTCFHDFKTANANMEEMGLKNTGDHIFYDGEYTTWLDPAKPEARRYVRNMVLELADLGFDEILLADFSYPTAGKLDKIAYSAEGELYEDLEAFLQELREDLAERDVLLSIEPTAKAAAEGEDPEAGQRLAAIAPQVDRICVPTAGSEAEALRAAVEAAGETVAFLPELSGAEEILEPERGYLLLP